MYYKEEDKEEGEDGYDASGCSSVVFCGLLFSYYCVSLTIEVINTTYYYLDSCIT